MRSICVLAVALVGLSPLAASAEELAVCTWRSLQSDFAEPRVKLPLTIRQNLTSAVMPKSAATLFDENWLTAEHEGSTLTVSKSAFAEFARLLTDGVDDEICLQTIRPGTKNTGESCAPESEHLFPPGPLHDVNTGAIELEIQRLRFRTSLTNPALFDLELAVVYRFLSERAVATERSTWSALKARYH